MKLDEIKTGSEVFVDSNIFIYHFTGVSDECGNFLNRCEQGDLTAITSVNVILEVLHRLIIEMRDVAAKLHYFVGCIYKKKGPYQINYYCSLFVLNRFITFSSLWINNCPRSRHILLQHP